MALARWRDAARMHIARDRLAAVRRPVPSRRLGCRHLPTFSAAFSHLHGTSPRKLFAFWLVGHRRPTGGRERAATVRLVVADT